MVVVSHCANTPYATGASLSGIKNQAPVVSPWYVNARLVDWNIATAVLPWIVTRPCSAWPPSGADRKTFGVAFSWRACLAPTLARAGWTLKRAKMSISKLARRMAIVKFNTKLELNQKRQDATPVFLDLTQIRLLALQRACQQTDRKRTRLNHS